MKWILFCVFFVSGILNSNAQSNTEYNIQGDSAFQNKDYQAARNWYGIGLNSCDPYSIGKLVDIWIDQPPMQESMRRTMQRCFDCMKKNVEEENPEPEAIRLYSEFYRRGIGTAQNADSADSWYNKWRETNRPDPDIPPDNFNPPADSSVIKTPKRSLLSNRFSSFVAYIASPTMPFGLTAGIYFDKIGGYVSYRNNFKAINYAYECNNTKVPDIDIENPPYEFNRESWHSQMITGGLLFPVIKNRLFLSAGGGYGIRDYYREIRTVGNQTFPKTGGNSAWCYNTEASYKGLTFEAGGMFVWKKLTALGGINSTQWKDLDVYFGLGLTF